MRDLGGLAGWLGRGSRVGGWVGLLRRTRKLGQWCYSDLASSLASSGAASTCGTQQTEHNRSKRLRGADEAGGGSETRSHLVGLGLSVLRVVFLVCLCLDVLLRLLGLLVFLLVIHSLFFLQGRQKKGLNIQCSCHGGMQGPPRVWLLPLLPSWPFVLAWAGSVSVRRKQQEGIKEVLYLNKILLPTKTCSFTGFSESS